METRKYYTTLVFSCLFLLGMVVILFSYSLGEYVSRNYEGPNMWSISSEEVYFRTVAFLEAGGILTLISGLGLVKIITTSQKGKKTDEVSPEAQ